MRFTIIFISISTALLFSGIAAADQMTEAKAAFEEGKELFVAEKYVEAADAFRKANELNPNWRLLYNIGQSEAAAKRYGLSLDAFEKYLAAGGDEVPQERQQEVLEEVQRLRNMVGVLEVSGQDGDLLEVNGVQRGELPDASRVKIGMGQVAIRVLRGGEEVLVRTIAISGGETIELTVPTDEDPGAENQLPGSGDRKKKLRTGGWISIGVGAALLVGGGVTGGMALSMNGDLKDQCGDGSCTTAAKQEDLDKRDGLATASTVLLAAGGVVAATGIVFLVAGIVGKEESDSGETGEVALVPSLGPGFAGAAISGRF